MTELQFYVDFEGWLIGICWGIEDDRWKYLTIRLLCFCFIIRKDTL